MLAALTSAPVHRLQRTWTLLGQRERAFVQDCLKLMAADRNFEAYRKRWGALTAGEGQRVPCVPYLGVFLGDLVFLAESAAAAATATVAPAEKAPEAGAPAAAAATPAPEPAPVAAKAPSKDEQVRRPCSSILPRPS